MDGHSSANRVFTKVLLPTELFTDPARLLGVLLGPGASAWLEARWAQACALAREPAGAGLPQVIARGADRRSVLLAVPRADAPNDTAFVAAIDRGDGPKLWLYERTLDATLRHLSQTEGVLAVVEPSGRRATFGPQPGLDEAAVLRAMGSALGPVERARPARSTPWITLAVSVVLLLVGLLTWTEARREATSFSNDWVLLSTPLLALGFAGLTYFAGRLLGKPGWIGGALVGVGVVVGLLVELGVRIDERAVVSREYARFEALRGFCEGKGRAEASARPYRQGAPNPTLVMTTPFEGARFQQEFSGRLAKWRPETSRVEQTALVACVAVEPAQVIQRCAYDIGTLTRVRESRSVSLYEIRTGKLLTRTVLTGPMPASCETVEKFYGKGDSTRGGGRPSDDEVAAALRPYVE